jgi:hypothetical protein
MKFWIARDKDGFIYIYRNKPYQLTEGIWTCEDKKYAIIEDEIFPEITSENSPLEVELKLMKE